MSENRDDRFVSQGFKGVTLIKAQRRGKPLLAGRTRHPTTASKVSNLGKTVKLTPELQAIVGQKEMARAQVVKKVWEYIKSNNLQNPRDRTEILPDAKLKRVISKDRVGMFEMTKFYFRHISEAKSDTQTRKKESS